jgi:hypothetical protein
MTNQYQEPGSLLRKHQQTRFTMADYQNAVTASGKDLSRPGPGLLQNDAGHRAAYHQSQE